MARNSGVVMVPGRGHYFTAPVDTPFPTDPKAPETPWEEVGHTSRDEPLQVSRDGDDPEVRGSWQDPNLLTVQNPPTYTLAFSSLQYDEQSMKLYYGSNAEVDSTTGRVKTPKTPVPTETALFVRIVDGVKEQYRYYPRVSIQAADSEEFDVEQLAAMPLAATILGSAGSDFSAELSPVIDTSAPEAA